MARATLALAVLAILCAGAMAQYVRVFVRWDNTLTQTNKNEKAIHEEIAKRLCKVPVGVVGTLLTLDKSVLVNTESWGYYYCMAANTTEVSKIFNTCNNKRFQKTFKEDLEDRTTRPEQEAEAITCSQHAGSPSVTGRRMA